MDLKRRALIIASVCVLMATGTVSAQTDDDPLKPLNKPIYYVNNVIDALYLKPTVVVYDNVFPYPVKASVSSFYSNIYTTITIVNDILQFNIKNLVKDAARLLINSTLGLAGLFDVATPMGIQPHKSNLGETFYCWGWKNSSYFVIPLLGPSTIRDAIGLVGEFWLWPPSYLEPKWRNRSYFLALVNRRYEARDLEALIGVAGVESYELVRSSYLQNREFTLTGGVTKTESHNGLDMLGEPPA